ncbi:MAG: hypothetical protein US50_C0005G0004 [Candidatus Nomurabacteria bacterium GW2011_GWB1_37_5]|uniref:Uncharacterized protein n=1 Tax=Candidatus Nomurabacteria bacterium GW2011_GWB1_37_5 TaxID=1618742 RepID=A0A0G0GXR7_9BACT|nr:MAG: hypothetical protein US50_C0005G0004 [Candidatus Nomurabacteria bacterium GW2011_GWB1_37_5]
MQNGNIFETRGVADSKQNLEGNMTEIAEQKMSELPGKEKYQKISGDMKKMTAIYEKSFKEDKKTGEKTYLNPEFSKDELIFVYEINNSIDGFGYQKDPRIAEIRKERKSKEDAPVVFGCKPEEVAYGLKEINKNTKAYIGEWNPEVHNKIPKDIEYLYEKFPETKIFRKSLELTTRTPKQYTNEIEAQGMKIYEYAQDMLNKMEPLKSREKIDLVSFSVAQLGYPNGTTLQQIYDKAKELGLELCPPQVGPELRLSYKDQPSNEYLRIAMNSITDRDDNPRIFHVNHGSDGLWLSYSYGISDRMWVGNNRFVFASRKN